MTLRKILFLFCLAGFISCQKPNPNNSLDNLNEGELVILGHKGMGETYKYPGNTYDGIIPVLGIGADGTELDIQMTKDRVLVLFHHEKMEAETNCNNQVSNYNFDEIKGCKYYAFDQNIYVTSLDDLLSQIEGVSSYQFSFDCKLYDKEEDIAYSSAFFEEVISICDKYNITDNTYLELNYSVAKRAILTGVKNKIFIVGSDGINTRIKQAIRLNAYGVGSNWKEVSKENVEKAHEFGLWVMLWSPITHSQNKNALHLHPDILQTDKPIKLLKMFDRYNYEYHIP